jgi:hypothetical protein
MLSKIAAVLPGLMRDAAGLIGAGLVVWGCHLVYPPSAFLVAGGFLLAGAWQLGRSAE